MLERKVYNNDDITSCDNMLQHMMANVNIRKGMFYPRLLLQGNNLIEPDCFVSYN